MKVFLLPKVVRELKKLPREMHEVIIGKIKSLADCSFPSGCKKLINREGWRMRVGDYRILYMVDNDRKQIIIFNIAHRKDIYRQIN